MNGINVVSLCDGITCLQLALKESNIKVEHYGASEIEPHAISITQYNFPKTNQLGDLTKLTKEQVQSWGKIDLIGLGSPCVSFSKLGNGSGFQGKSGLIYDCFKIVKWLYEINPNIKILCENVEMKKEWEKEITQCLLEIFPTIYVNHINSKDFSAQSRPRVYWTNFQVDKINQTNNLVIKDVVGEVEFVKPPNYLLGDYCSKRRLDLVQDINKKASCLTATMWKGQIGSFCKYEDLVYKYTPNDCEAFQTLPKNYTLLGNYNGIIKKVSNTNRFITLGNCWNIKTVSFILNHIK